MNNALFGKKMENVRKFRDIKLVTTGKRRDQLVSEGKYHKKMFSEKLLAVGPKKTNIKRIGQYIQDYQYQKVVKH